MVFIPNDAGINALLNDPNSPLMLELRRRALLAEGEARRLAPVDTGRMRASIHTHGPIRGDTGAAYDIVAATYYAWFVHQGTRYMRGRPFLLDALRQAVM